MNLKVAAHAVYHTAQEIPALLQLEVSDAPGQHLTNETLEIGPPLEATPFLDIFGNRNRQLVAPAGADLTIDYHAQVALDSDTSPIAPRDFAAVPTSQLPPRGIAMTFPSRYCQSDLLAQAASDLFGSGKTGAALVYEICDWMFNKVTYEYGHTTATTSAADIFLTRIGVCRDFSHLAITFCRALNLPARYAAGYCLELDPPDFHAYFQVYLAAPNPTDDAPGQWYSFDATTENLRRGLVNISVGRDAVDTSMLTFFGSAELVEQMVSVQEIE